MAYRLVPCEPTPEEIRRVAVEQLDAAVADLLPNGDGRGPDAEAIHDARKRLKKTRSLIRLARADFDTPFRRQVNAQLREAGRSLSARRDAYALVETSVRLLEASEEQRFTEPLKRLQAWLETRTDKSSEDDSEDGVGAVAARLAETRDRVAAQHAGAAGWRALEPGLRLQYMRGRDELRELDNASSDEDWHEWRKRAKDLWYHLDLLRNAWPEVVKPLADQASHLADLLGEDHDLAVLRSLLDDQNSPVEDIAPIFELLADEQARLRAAAIELGRRLYADKARTWTGRIGAWWTLAEQRSPRSLLAASRSEQRA